MASPLPVFQQGFQGRDEPATKKIIILLVILIVIVILINIFQQGSEWRDAPAEIIIIRPKKSSHDHKHPIIILFSYHDIVIFI